MDTYEHYFVASELHSCCMHIRMSHRLLWLWVYQDNPVGATDKRCNTWNTVATHSAYVLVVAILVYVNPQSRAIFCTQVDSMTPLTKNRYDLFFLLNVIHDIQEPIRMLRSVCQIGCRDEAIFLNSKPYRPSRWTSRFPLFTYCKIPRRPLPWGRFSPPTASTTRSCDIGVLQKEI